LNPNTGEIRGASVYYNAIWLQAAIAELDPSAQATARTFNPLARPKAPQITWGDLRATPLCTLFGDAGLTSILRGQDTSGRAFAGIDQAYFAGLAPSCARARRRIERGPGASSIGSWR